MGKLTVNVGGMFSGKSTLLQQQGRRHFCANQKVVYVKPSLDNRYSDDEIVTHDGKSVSAINIESSLKEYPELFSADVVLIDEIQFFKLNVVLEILELLKKGIDVYVSGLDMDYKGLGFAIVMTLMTMADEVNKLKSICECCGSSDAGMTGKRDVSISSCERFELGDQTLYIPLCRDCYYKLKFEGCIRNE